MNTITAPKLADNPGKTEENPHKTAENPIHFREIRIKHYFGKFLGIIKRALVGIISRAVADKFLVVLLRIMSLILIIDSNFRKNIKDFEAEYLFINGKSNIHVAAIFKDNKLKIRKRQVSDPKVTLVFKDGEAIMKLLLSYPPNIFEAALKQEIDFKGNLNYLIKFAYMALTLRNMALPPGGTNENTIHFSNQKGQY
ncbi:MAG: hypothetical protein FWF85_00635 [Clostridiales bacterium]|nr:hypothetical protein [Clostridiales bacterium]